MYGGEKVVKSRALSGRCINKSYPILATHESYKHATDKSVVKTYLHVYIYIYKGQRGDILVFLALPIVLYASLYLYIR